jgi:chromosome segregation ATPase
MQTDSVLDAQDREIMWRWGQPATREFFTENASNCFRIAGELSRLEQENQRLQARVDSLDCAHKLALGEVERLKKDNHRLRLEAEGLEEVARRWQASWNVERNDLSAFRAEVQRLRENAEMDQAQRAEWQETIDKLEAENTRISNQLRLALIISEPGKVDQVMERIEKLEGDAGRIALLEGRIQGIAEAAKERLDSHDFRLRALEANGWSGIPVTVASNIPPFNQGYNDGKPARNPFEDLRPPRGL